MASRRDNTRAKCPSENNAAIRTWHTRSCAVPLASLGSVSIAARAGRFLACRNIRARRQPCRSHGSDGGAERDHRPGGRRSLRGLRYLPTVRPGTRPRAGGPGEGSTGEQAGLPNGAVRVTNFFPREERKIPKRHGPRRRAKGGASANNKAGRGGLTKRLQATNASADCSLCQAWRLRSVMPMLPIDRPTRCAEGRSSR